MRGCVPSATRLESDRRAMQTAHAPTGAPPSQLALAPPPPPPPPTSHLHLHPPPTTPHALGLLQVRVFMACVLGRFRVALAPSMGDPKDVMSKIKGDLVMSFGNGLQMLFRDRTAPQV